MDELSDALTKLVKDFGVTSFAFPDDNGLPP